MLCFYIINSPSVLFLRSVNKQKSFRTSPLYHILLIDDEVIISEIITDILCTYLEKNYVEFKLYTATNGQEALDICTQNTIHLAFMDINMPIMDGIEATQKIKINSPKTMIIALSSIEDDLKHREILISGAEDYINKPISSIIFKTRLKNYLSILDSRSHIDIVHSAKNLFSSTIYNHNLSFGISKEDHLAEFWESILIRMNLLKEVEHSQDIVRLIYELGSLYLQASQSFKIIIEEDEKNYYFTLTHANIIPKRLLDRLVEKNFPSVRHILNDNRFSILLPKTSEVEHIQETKNPPLQQAIQTISSLGKEEYKTYTFLQSDEIEEFEDNLYKLHAIITGLASEETSSAHIQNIISYCDAMKKVLIQTSESYAIASAIEEFGSTISAYPQEFIQMSQDLQSIALGFIDDLISWKEMIFYEGAPRLDFMNDSISANAKILQELLNPCETNEEELDDIFTF